MKTIIGKVVYVDSERLVMLDSADEEVEVDLTGKGQELVDVLTTLIEKRVLCTQLGSSFRLEELGRVIESDYFPYMELFERANIMPSDQIRSLGQVNTKYMPKPKPLPLILGTPFSETPFQMPTGEYIPKVKPTYVPKSKPSGHRMK